MMSLAHSASPTTRLRRRALRQLRPRTWGVAFTLLVGQVGVARGALVINILSARTLGPTGRGELALYLQIAYVVSELVILGRDRALLAVPLPEGHGARRSGNRLLIVPTILTVPVAVVIGVWFHGATPLTWALGGAMMLLVVANCFQRITRTVAIVDGAPWRFTSPVLTSQVLLIGVGVVMLAAGAGDPVLWLILYALTLGLPFLVVAAGWGDSRESAPAGLGAAGALGLRLLPSTMAQMLLLRADRLLLPALASYRELGLYVVAATMTDVAGWPIRQMIDSKMPDLARLHRAGTLRPFPIVVKVMAVALALGAAVGAVTYVTLPWLFGDQYAEARALVPVLTAGVVLYSTSAVGTAIATVSHKARWAAWISGAGMAAGLVGYVVLIPAMGAMGAALASAGGYLVCWLVSLVAVFRLSGSRASAQGVT